MKQHPSSPQTTLNRLWWLGCALIFFLVSCSHINSPKERQLQTQQLANKHQWNSRVINTDTFDLVAFLPNDIQPKKELVIYIEGDGLAWQNRETVSSDPTPITPVALQLALEDFKNENNLSYNVVYLARPCQFVTDEHKKNCEPSVWTSGRFSEKNVATMNQAIDQLKILFKAESIELVGYSGGAAVACLVAARRDDIKKIITVAGNLDHAYWTQLHGVSPLTDSLNPSDFREHIKHIPQLHLVGEKDKIIPPEMIKQFVAGFSQGEPNKNALVRYQIKPKFDHRCCWVKKWNEILVNTDD